MAELLRTERLTKRFEGLLANDAIDFRLASGELRCVIGPNGAGKTTFISMISGHLQPTAGTIWYQGEPITQLAVPVVTVQLGMMLMGTVDTVMLGRYSAAALAAASLGNAVAGALTLLVWGTVLALDPLVAQAYGARDSAAITSSARISPSGRRLGRAGTSRTCCSPSWCSPWSRTSCSTAPG